MSYESIDTSDFASDALDNESHEGEHEEEHEEEPAPPEKHELDYLGDQQLIEMVNDLETENKHLALENRVFTEFLRINDPMSLEGFDNLINYMSKPSDKRTPLPARIALSTQSIVAASPSTTRRSIRLDSFSSLTSITEGRGPKVNLTQKSDMVLRAMEETQSNLEIFLKKSQRIRRNLKAELEEFRIRESDIRVARDIFEYNIVTQGVDPLTQRIPAEKFIRYMEEWLKSAQLNIEKLRLRTASLKMQYRKVSAILVQRQELGQNVHSVDFDQLEIENKHFATKIDQKSIHLVELKKMNGGANLVLTNHNKYLRKQQKEYNKLRSMIAEKERLIEKTEEECDQIEAELKKANEKYDNFKILRKSYRVPDVIEYVKLKKDLFEVKKNIKVWQRRKKIQDITLNACLRQMKNITGSPKLDLAWLEDLNPDDTNETDEWPESCTTDNT